MEGGGEGYGGINGDGRRLDLGWWTHSTVHRWCVVELCTWSLYNFVCQCHPNKFNKKEKIKIFKKFKYAKVKFGHRQTCPEWRRCEDIQGEGHVNMKTEIRAKHLQAKNCQRSPADHPKRHGEVPHSVSKEPTLPTPWFLTSSLQDCETQFVVLCYGDSRKLIHTLTKIFS